MTIVGRHLHVPYLQEVLKGWLQEFSHLGVWHHVCYYWVWAPLCQRGGQCHSVIPRPSKIPHPTQNIPCPQQKDRQYLLKYARAR